MWLSVGPEQSDLGLHSVFLFSILGMVVPGAGSFELGKFTRKVENWEKFMCMKNAVPFSKQSLIQSSYYFVSLENFLTLFWV